MSLPGLLIEYLITGLTGAMWILVIVEVLSPGTLDMKDVSAAHMTALVPLGYVLGMVLDYIGAMLATALRRIIADPVNHRVGPQVARLLPTRWRGACRFFRGDGVINKPDFNQAEILLRSTPLGEQYEMRSSRDRIARGLFANVTIAAIVLKLFAADLPPVFRQAWTGFAVSAILLTFGIWFRFHQLTRRFVASAAVVLRDNNPPVVLTKANS
jgi:hypothetical protein